MRQQLPVTKFDPSLVNPQMQPDPSVMSSFDAWEGPDYGVPPMLDQFPDYDWAAGFEFSNAEMPNVPVGPINPMMTAPGPGGAPNWYITYGCLLCATKDGSLNTRSRWRGPVDHVRIRREVIAMSENCSIRSMRAAPRIRRDA